MSVLMRRSLLATHDPAVDLLALPSTSRRLAFSVLIILSIADIYRDPPYVYLVSMIMLGGGAIWHLVQRARNRREQKALEAAKAQAAIVAADKA